MRRIALVGALVAACGDGDGGEPIEGTWGILGDPCVVALDFDDGSVALMTVCELEDGTTAIEAQRGTYELDDGVVVLRTTETTCPPEPDDYESERVDYVVDGDTLTLAFDEGIVAFERVESEGGSGVGTLGCFGEDGSFTPGKLRRL